MSTATFTPIVIKKLGGTATDKEKAKDLPVVEPAPTAVEWVTPEFVPVQPRKYASSSNNSTRSSKASARSRESSVAFNLEVSATASEKELYVENFERELSISGVEIEPKPKQVQPKEKIAKAQKEKK